MGVGELKEKPLKQIKRKEERGGRRWVKEKKRGTEGRIKKRERKMGERKEEDEWGEERGR